MWKSHEPVLVDYARAIINEWTSRGYKDSQMRNIDMIEHFYIKGCMTVNFNPPWWLGLDEFHASHRSNLLRKDPIYYGQFGWSEADDMPYFWPIKHLDERSN